MRWGRTALCTLAVVTTALLTTAPAAASGHSRSAAAIDARAIADAPPLSLVSQTTWVTPTQPWFNLTVGVGSSAGSAAGLRVAVTYYSRVNSASQLQQAIGGTPGGTVLGRYPDVAVTSSSPGQLSTASSCVTVLRDSRDTPPASGTGVCPSGSLSIDMGCTPLRGTCGDVYPVTVALYRQSSTTPVAHLTTFLTYQEAGAPGSISLTGGPLDVGVVLPDSNAVTTKVLAATLPDHRDVPTTLAISPTEVEKAETAAPKEETRAVAQLNALSNDQVLAQPYVPIDLAAMSEAGIPGEIGAQMIRGNDVLHITGLRPTSGTWVDTTSSFSQGDASDLAAGLQQAGSSHLVVSDGDLSNSDLGNLTFAQPFTLDLGHGSTVTAAAADSSLSARFTADPRDPVLGAEQLLAGLFFVHFENASLADHRGIVIMPPANWRASKPFLETLLGGLSQNAALSPVTLDQLFAQVPVGGNHEASVRHLQVGPATHGIPHGSAVKIAQARQQLSSYTEAIGGHTPIELVALSDALLSTEAQALGPARRAAVITSYQHAFADQTEKISLAGQETVTFTAQQASIPITVLSSAPYPVTVVVTLNSDKFTFPNGNTHRLLLDRPTTSWRFTAQARTSGDRLPIEVTVHTQNGDLLLAHSVLTVHSTAISFVGVALTVLAGAVLLVWWARTWRKSRRQRPRAH
jgi:hypothetical protein